MPTTLVHRLLFAAALIAIALLADAWRSEHRDATKLAATLATQNAAIQQSADREKQRDTQLAAALSAIAAQKRAVLTPHQAAVAIPSILPSLPLPISIRIPNLTPSAKPDGADDLPATITVPQPDLKPLYDELQDCRAATLQNTAVQKDLADEKLRSSAIAKERDAAIHVAQGGSFWIRLKREAKWFAIGVAAGAAATALTRH
jgi:hypothetical protein